MNRAEILWGFGKLKLYPKHKEFFAATKSNRFTMFLAGNRTGKTSAGVTVLCLSVTGLYPEWWEGGEIQLPY